MRLTVGPVPSAHVRAWMDVAIRSIGALERSEVEVPFHVAQASMERALYYFAEWAEVIEAGETFSWEADTDPDEILLIVQYWHNISRAMLDEARHDPTWATSPEGELFADHLLRVILDALVVEERLEPATAERMWSLWPRLDVLGRPPGGAGD